MPASALFSLAGRRTIYARLGLMLALSALLHGALILAVRVGQVERPGTSPQRLTVRLANADRPIPPRPQQQPVPLRALEKPLPLTQPAARPAVPQPEPAPPSPAASAQSVQPQQATPSGAKPGMPEAAAAATTLDVPLPEDTTYYPARDVDEHPLLVSGGRPVYPEQAARDNVKGEVTVLMLLNEHGAADEVSIIDARPAGQGFEQAVLAWLRDARFKPAMRKGRAVKARVVYHVTFEP
jgi:protein TonB